MSKEIISEALHNLAIINNILKHYRGSFEHLATKKLEGYKVNTELKMYNLDFNNVSVTIREVEDRVFSIVGSVKVWQPLGLLYANIPYDELITKREKIDEYLIIDNKIEKIKEIFNETANQGTYFNAEFVCDHPYDEDCEIDREDYLDLFYMLKHIKEIIEE
jgi:hypothetical protein